MSGPGRAWRRRDGGTEPGRGRRNRPGTGTFVRARPRRWWAGAGSGVKTVGLGGAMHTTTRTTGSLVRLGPGPAPQPQQPFPVSKLRGLTLPVRAALKRRGIATCERLLRAAGRAGDRARLAREAGIDPGALLALVRQADLARVGGIGTVFGLMLEDLDVHDVPALAAQDPVWLHARLRRHNEQEPLARRAPTPA